MSHGVDRFILVALLVCACRTAPEPLPERHENLSSSTSTGVKFVPGPELVLGLRFVRPEATYGALRTVASRALPQSAAVLLTAMLGLNPTLSGRFVGGQDWYGVFTVEDEAQWGWALGVPVISGRELVAEVALGSDARLKANRREGWTEFTGGVVGPVGTLAAGVSGNFLVIGSTTTAVSALAPWLARRGGVLELAPTQAEAGVSARLFSSGLGLQAIFAAWRETWLPALLRVAAGSSASSSLLPLADVERGWSDSISAYLGTITEGDFHVQWSGEKLILKGDLAAPEAPLVTRGSQLCRAVAGLPRATRWWVGGTDAGIDSQGAAKQGAAKGGAPEQGALELQGALEGTLELQGAQGSARRPSPDWDEPLGEWQLSLFHGLSGIATAWVVGTPPTPVVRQQPGVWLLAWREEGQSSTALGVLNGVSPMLHGQMTSGRLSSRPHQGKPVEWAWATRDGGLVTALGAPLGDEWAAWVGSSSATGWPRGLSPSACERLLAALGSEDGVMLALERNNTGLQVSGAVALSTLSGALQ